ncbi:MAG: redoxin domain-containing protein [Planctomycetaceae bacterium]|nr:redoxin domain-containing protein [Planctomycetaceae bacterium]
MKPRDLVLLLSAVAILGLVTWRLNRENNQPDASRTTSEVRRLAPRFELYDQHSKLVKFERYLGRTRLVVLFIADAPPDEHPLFQALASKHSAIAAAGVQVIVVSTATPFAVREAEEQRGAEFPFPVLTDIDQKTPVPTPTHRQWGLAGDDPADLRDGLFLIERDGTVTWNGNTPRAESDPAKSIEAIQKGEWPT